MTKGVLSALTAFLIWGLFPLYFKQLAQVPPEQVLAHRVVWSLVLVMAVLAWQGRWRWLAEAGRNLAQTGRMAAAAVLLALNWWVYVWSVINGHVVEASLGYFLNPLVNVLLGYAVLGERLRRVQWAAVALAAAGAAILTWQTGRVPWIALVLAASFGLYGLLRKQAPLGPLEGLGFETLVLAAPAVLAMAWWTWQGSAAFPAADFATNAWLVGTGPITAVTLLFFAAGARALPLATLGFLQYLTPTLQFALGVWVFQEPFGLEKLLGFAVIWIALAIYSGEGWWAARRRRSAGP